MPVLYLKVVSYCTVHGMKPCFPSTQLKNMVNALFASRQGGTKCFRLRSDESDFGWEAISKLWERECTRIREGKIRKVPKLQPSYIERDSWTKLNVAPAKIMQVNSPR